MTDWHKVPRYTTPPPEKRCPSCEATYEASNFYINRYRNGGLSTYCKGCTREQARARSKIKPRRYQSAGRRQRSCGVTQEQYEAMSRAQGGLCGICGQPETTTRGGKLISLAVDHCHQSGHVRGLLCRACNTALGLFADSPERLMEAAQYLRSN